MLKLTIPLLGEKILNYLYPLLANLLDITVLLAY